MFLLEEKRKKRESRHVITINQHSCRWRGRSGKPSSGSCWSPGIENPPSKHSKDNSQSSIAASGTLIAGYHDTIVGRTGGSLFVCLSLKPIHFHSHTQGLHYGFDIVRHQMTGSNFHLFNISFLNEALHLLGAEREAVVTFLGIRVLPKI